MTVMKLLFFSLLLIFATTQPREQARIITINEMIITNRTEPIKAFALYAWQR